MMLREFTFEEKIRRHDYRMAWIELTSLDTELFRIETRLRHLEIDWPGSTPEKQRRLRIERSRLRCDFELLKVDLRKLERRIESLSPST
jgi:hypothetical protein